MTRNSRVTRDEVFKLLSNRRRRYAVHACKRSEAPVELGDLSEQVAAWEHGKMPSEVSYDERRSVYSAMQQTHLPTMEDAGVVEVERSEIELTDAARELDIYLDIVPENSIPWAEYYLGLTFVAVLLVASVWTGIYPSSIPDIAWTGLIVTGFLASSVYHVWWNRCMKLGANETPREVNG